MAASEVPRQVCKVKLRGNSHGKQKRVRFQGKYAAGCVLGGGQLEEGKNELQVVSFDTGSEQLA